MHCAGDSTGKVPLLDSTFLVLGHYPYWIAALFGHGCLLIDSIIPLQELAVSLCYCLGLNQFLSGLIVLRSTQIWSLFCMLGLVRCLINSNILHLWRPLVLMKKKQQGVNLGKNLNIDLLTEQCYNQNNIEYHYILYIFVLINQKLVESLHTLKCLKALLLSFRPIIVSETCLPSIVRKCFSRCLLGCSGLCAMRPRD